jgi:hypothetical protein
MRRREFVAAIGGAAVLPLVARAQQLPQKIPVVGILWHAANAEEEDVYLKIVKQAFADLGYVARTFDWKVASRQSNRIGSARWRASLLNLSPTSLSP